MRRSIIIIGILTQFLFKQESGSGTADQVHDHTRTLLRTVDSGPSYYQCSALLSQEESSYQEYIGVPAEPYITKDSHGDDEWNRDMDGEEPLGREASDIRSPVPEWDIQDKYDNADDYEYTHGIQN